MTYWININKVHKEKLYHLF